MSRLKKLKNNKGLSLIETLIAIVVVSIFMYQTYSFMSFIYKKTSDFNKSLDLIETYEELKRLLSDSEICTKNFSSKSMRQNFSIDKVYGLDQNSSLNKSQSLFFTPENIDIIFNFDDIKPASSGSHLYNGIINLIGNNRTMSLPIFILEDYGKIKECSTQRLLEDIEDGQMLTCNLENKGEARYFENAGEVMYCNGVSWTSIDKTAGTFISMLTSGTPCRHKNIHTNACSCPYGFTAEPVATIANYKCANGVLDTWIDKNGNQQNVEDGRCGVRVFLCKK